MEILRCGLSSSFSKAFSLRHIAGSSNLFFEYYLTLAILLMGFGLAAHPISISWATLHAYPDKVDVQFNILAEDLFLFHAIAPDDNGMFPPATLQAAAEKHQAFLSQYFFLEGLDGQRLEGRFIRCQPFDMPAGGIHRDSLMQYSLLYFFEYCTAQPMSGLRAYQQFGGSRAAVPAVMMASAFQEGAQAPLLSEISFGHPWLLHFDWETPGNFGRDKGQPSPFARKEDLTTLLQINEAGIWQEISLPFEKLETLMPVPRARAACLERSEEVLLKHDVAACFSRQARITADGVPLYPVSVHVAFSGAQGADGLLLADAAVQVELFYPLEKAPDDVVVSWDLFSWQARSWALEATAFGQSSRFTFSRYQPEFHWQRDTGEAGQKAGGE
ncbi:MAG: hypothetical protein KDC66_04180 [Phaeodactylibacter sp.]|nr:hypothetical protein [Phaeodactylibacter sp.]